MIEFYLDGIKIVYGKKSLMNNKITFTDMLNIDKEFYPKPSSTVIPQWYKESKSYLNNKKEVDIAANPLGTIKKCIPVFDAMTSGYIISTYTDIFISRNPIVVDGKEFPDTQYIWSSMNPIEFHALWQADKHPNIVDEVSPKFINAFGIKTPKGYSTLFCNPMHRENIFNILPGVVDTDRYSAPINFPFVFTDPNFEGIIPAGTPIAQVIPFKRDNWKMEIGNNKDFENTFEIIKKHKTRFFEFYKNNYRVFKQYE